MQNRVARVAPKEGKWEAYFADKPHERCLGCTPEEALARLRFHATKCEKQEFDARQRARRMPPKPRPRMSLGILATVVIGGIATIVVLLMQSTPAAVGHHSKMYAHHRMHNANQ